MSKIILNPLVNLQNETTAVSTINGNSTTVQTAFDNTLSRDGTSPNQMGSTLDMNSNRTINLPDPVSITEPVTLNYLNHILAGGDQTSGLINGVPVSSFMQPVVDAANGLNVQGLLGTSPAFSTQTLAALANIPSSIQFLTTAGLTTLGDGGGALYYKVSGTSVGGFQSADGAWWALSLGSGGGGTPAANFPVSNDACIRIACLGTATEYYIIYHGGGNGLWLYSPIRTRWEFCYINGAGTTVDITNCSIDGIAGQSLTAGTRYYIYAQAPAIAGGFVSVDHSTTGYSLGDPFGQTIVTGYAFKNGTGYNNRLVGIAQPDPSGRIFYAGTRGVMYTGASGYYQKQRIIEQTKPALLGGAFNNNNWAELNSTLYVGGIWWGDGSGEWDVTLTGDVSSDTAGTVVSVGVSQNGETPPYDYVDIACNVATSRYPFAVTVSTEFDTVDAATYFRTFVKTTSGNATLINATLTANMNI